MKLTATFELRPAERDALLAAIAAMLRTLPTTIKVQIVETRTTVLIGGDVQRGIDAEGPTPLEQAIAETTHEENAP